MPNGRWTSKGKTSPFGLCLADGGPEPFHLLTENSRALAGRVCKSPEEYKAWSQNLGHENVLTTFSSYGDVAGYRQAEIIRSLGINQTGP
jgi:hypothetical protein